jgi:hypothetical protein
MSFFIDAVQVDAFGWVMDYFKGRNMKIIASNSPSYIKAEFGSWFSMYPGNAKGNVEVKLVKRNGGTYVNPNFSFLLYYLIGLIIAVIAALILSVFVEWLAIANPLNRELGDFPAIAPWLALGQSGLVICIALLLLGYDASKTRRNFIEEFNIFVQSLASKKE